MWFRTRSRRAAGDQDTGFGLSNAGQSQNSKLTVKVRVRNVPVRRCASGGSLKADLEREWRGSMPIRARTSDNGVDVHGNPDSLCATALPYVVGRLAVARRPPERRCRSGACGRGWERPPLRDAWYGIGEGRHGHAHATLPQGSLSVQRSLREGYSAPLRGGGSPVLPTAQPVCLRYRRGPGADPRRTPDRGLPGTSSHESAFRISGDVGMWENPDPTVPGSISSPARSRSR